MDDNDMAEYSFAPESANADHMQDPLEYQALVDNIGMHSFPQNQASTDDIYSSSQSVDGFEGLSNLTPDTIVFNQWKAKWGERVETLSMRENGMKLPDIMASFKERKAMKERSWEHAIKKLKREASVLSLNCCQAADSCHR